ncbi:LuxR C-terminal-related transcriptional regulator [Chryseobacterium sp. OSA05B]|uniref:helix-turn-helix transcriptional regulator n=1 Tax=Chryseobacterium sp. OSA05B TaxID=2862650 RepID=UPI001CBB1886|nr:LuxR C-terminal-related transcriptional regulator [Chryseobacterium sp. OSA05B]
MNFKSTLLLICLLFVSVYNAQNYTAYQIDSLQSAGYKRLSSVGDYKGIVLQQLKLIERAKVIHYDKGEIAGYLNIAIVLRVINDSKNSFRFLEIAEKKLENFKDNELKSRLVFFYGTNYHSLGLDREAIQSFNESLEIARKIKDSKVRENMKYLIYDWKLSSFSNLNIIDSVYIYERRCLKFPKPMLFITIAKRHLKNGSIDSADFYVRKANDLLLTKKVPIEGKANVLRAFGELSIAKKEYKKALVYLNESLEITEKMGFKKRNLEAYKLITDAYRYLHNTEKENEYLLKYSKLKDSLTNSERNILYIPISKFLANQDKDEQKNINSLYYIIIFISISICIVIFVFYKKSSIIKTQAAAKLLLEQNQNKGLQQKINESFAEVLKMAKNNSPQFWTRFQEVYPDFLGKMLLANSNLKVSELTFCAYIYLGFSTKEIAEYTFKAVKTIENNRYNLRKKLNLSPEQDLAIWMRG